MAMVTMEPYGYAKVTTKVLSLKPGEICTVNLEVHIPGSAHQAQPPYKDWYLSV